MANGLDIRSLPKYGRLTVIADAGKRGHNHQYVLCRCDCGNEKEVRLEHLRSHKIIRYRVKSGWPIERALTEPVKKRA